MKCLEFSLPSGAGGMAAGMTGSRIRKMLNDLVARKIIGGFKIKIKKYKLYVWLETDRDYTMFFLSWDQNRSWFKPTLIEKDYLDDQNDN